MIIVGLTGGIGSGKTTVAKMFSALGVPIYIADVEAKKLMVKSKVIKRKLILLFGEKTYLDGKINKPFIADKIFNNKDLLAQMNAIIHPCVKAHFMKWAKKQNAAYLIKEVAILFENGGYKACNYVVTVIAPENERIKRIMKRDNTSIENIRAILGNQWKDIEKIKLSHFIIENNTLLQTEKQVKKINKKILKLIDES